MTPLSQMRWWQKFGLLLKEGYRYPWPRENIMLGAGLRRCYVPPRDLVLD